MHGILHSGSHTQSDAWPAVLAFAVSAVVQGVELVFQDRAMRAPYHVKPTAALFWYNLYSLPAYLVTIPLESVKYLNGETEGKPISVAIANQIHAIRCSVGFPYPEDTQAVPGGEANCKPMAWFWPWVFVVGYVGMFLTNALLMRRFNAFWVGTVNTLGGPIAALVFACPSIVGKENSKHLEWWEMVSFAIILGGVWIKGFPKDPASSKPRVASTSAEPLAPLDA